MTAFYPYSFEGPVEYQDVGSDRYTYTVVWLPADIACELPLDTFPRLRIAGESNEMEFQSALMPVQGRWYILFSRQALGKMGVTVGDDVAIAFRIDDQDAVDIPQALAAALQQDEELARLWSLQTPGKQRGLAYRVATAKSPATQHRRVAEVADIMAGRRDARGKPIVGA